MSMSRRALVFAYACDPRKGSEPGAGAVLAETAALVADEVTVVTRFEPGLSSEALGVLLGSNVRVIQCGPKDNRLPTYARYFLWVLSAARIAAKLRRNERFSVLHHATYASDWFFNPLSFMAKRSHERWVWGPAGGASYAPYSVARIVTASAAISEVTRQVLTTTLRRLVLRSLRSRVDAAIALNRDSQIAFVRSGIRETVISSNAVLDYGNLPQIMEVPKTVTFAGRGVPWKGLRFLLAAFSRLPEDWQLNIAGPETDTPENRELARGLGHRVRFLGALDRKSALEVVSASTVMALPSLHDSAPWAAAEAAGMGVPVVCLDVGGVSAMAGQLAIPVKVTPSATLVERFAEALLASRSSERTPQTSHSRTRLKAVLTESYSIAGPS